MRQNQIVSAAAYNLFFRRREDKNIDDIDFDAIEQKPDLTFLDGVEQKRKSSKK